MSSITRKNKRRAAFKCAKQGIAPAQAIAVSAAREIKVTKEAAAETMEVLMCWPNNYINAAFRSRSAS